MTIRLKNKGPDAYNHAVYGDAIIIERKIGAEAGGGYTIKVSPEFLVLLPLTHTGRGSSNTCSKAR